MESLNLRSNVIGISGDNLCRVSLETLEGTSRMSPQHRPSRLRYLPPSTHEQSPSIAFLQDSATEFAARTDYHVATVFIVRKRLKYISLYTYIYGFIGYLSIIMWTLVPRRSLHYLFKRTKVPPLAQPKESPYIVGPYLKPDYHPTEYIIDPINPKDDDDFDHLIYEPIKVEPDQTRRVRLLLIKDVEGLGVAGQVVDAPFRHGASKLIAMRKAEYFNDFTQKWYKFGPRDLTSASSALSPRTVRMLASRVYDLPIARGTPVEPWHISLALRLVGCVCPIEAIDKATIKDSDPYVSCVITINNHEKVEVKFSYAKNPNE